MDRGDVVDSSSDEDNAVPSEKRATPRGPSEDPPGRLSGNFSKHKLGKIVGGGTRKKEVSSEPMQGLFCAQKAE
jgi:hypothetical protein